MRSSEHEHDNLLDSFNDSLDFDGFTPGDMATQLQQLEN